MYEDISTQELIEWMMMDLDHPKVRTACDNLQLNRIEFYNIDREDFMDPMFLGVLQNEYEELKQAIYKQMEIESTMEDNQMNGFYIPGDIWTEAEFVLNTLLGIITELINRVQD